MSHDYHTARLTPDARRDAVWRCLWRFYFCQQIAPDSCVLDLGCGYGSFINQVVARRRIAIDSWPEFPRFLAPGVEAIVGEATDLTFLEPFSVDFAFASNLFEHLSQPQFAAVLAGLHDKLNRNGMLTILQPNYRYAYREYFDDYTHTTIYSHVSIVDFLAVNGYEVMEVVPRFLPLTVKSRLPVSPLLIRAYLASPLKPMGKQMLVRARPRR
ncbi:MAG: class I SAM-dependent methyltransferase [Acetobacteraceae bacterium]